MSTRAEIEAAIAKLSPAEQSELAAWLDARLASAGFDPKVEQAWAGEVKRRVEELDRGRVQGVPAEHVFARVRQILGQ